MVRDPPPWPETPATAARAYGPLAPSRDRDAGAASTRPGRLRGVRLLLAIESSCDETAAAVVDDALNVRSNVVASQAELHAEYGGVVPEIASRAHLERLLPVLEGALKEAGVRAEDIDSVAVTTHPGLVGSLLVGLTAAKTLAWVWGVPLVAVNHVEAHLYACRMAAGREVFPAVGLVVSGGHSTLYDCRGPADFRVLGGTIDDAAGEAFDKVAALLGLGYPGGPAVSKAAETGDAAAVDLPRPMLRSGDFRMSFSGLKTAVRYAAHGIPGKEPAPELTPQRVADIAASFQEAAVDVLATKALAAVKKTGAGRLLVGGGVAANRRLREVLAERCQTRRVDLVVAPPEMCTDNAAMAGMAWELLDAGDVAGLDADVLPGLMR